VPANVLCLCPNCHVLFDAGALLIENDHTVLINRAPAGTLRTHDSHPIGPEYLAYHRRVHG
jgi:putative restriction endonuclease